MRKYLSLIDNGTYAVGCTGQTVYLLLKDGTELARFRDIRYGYTPLFRPGTDIAVVKSSEGSFAVYDVAAHTLIKKFSVRTGCAQDEGICFSADGSEFFDSEMQKELVSELVCYDGETFEEKRRIRPSCPAVIHALERGSEGYFALGYTRDEAGIFDKGFLVPFDGFSFGAVKYLPDARYRELARYKGVERMGFTQKAVEWSGIRPLKGEVRLGEIYSSL